MGKMVKKQSVLSENETRSLIDDVRKSQMKSNILNIFCLRDKIFSMGEKIFIPRAEIWHDVMTLS